MSSLRVTAFRWVPPFAQGLVRDLRVRWALEEAGLPYEITLIGFEDQNTPAYRAKQPFGQVPVLEDGKLVMFESCAILMHLGERSEALLPTDPALRAQVRTWMIAAINSVEPPITTLSAIELQPGGVPEGAKAFRESVLGRIGQRLDALTAFLGDRAYLVGERFTAADLLMTTVLRNLRTTDLVTGRPALAAYQRRHEARPAFAKALGDQMATFASHAPAAAAGA
ncbi:MAG: glutathione S-transferase family protein [Rhizobacter sp.]|nr:glutathione S-transferase family protein [Rhizobacter sp.]